MATQRALLLVVLATCIGSCVALMGTLQPGARFGQTFTFPETDPTQHIMVTAHATTPGGDVDLQCRPAMSPATASYPWTARLPAGVERLFINLADPAFDAVGRDKNNGIYCMVENTSNPPKPTDYELSVVFFPQQPILRPEDRAALEEIYDQCCSEPNACPKWKQLTPEGSPGPFLEFCGLPKQGCDGRGRLLQLNMDGWGLQCPFPAAALGKMASLMVLRMGTGHVFTGDMAPALATLGESLDALEVLHVAGNPAMGGPMIDPSVQLPAGTPPPLCKMATTLQLLQLSDNSIEGSIPACLVSSSSSIVFLDLGMNKLSGNIPDAWDAGSPMTDVFLDGNQLTGGVPRSIGNTQHLHTLNVTANRLNGAIDPFIGNAVSLMQLFVASNQLVGAIPDTLASHPNLTSLDVSNNQLDTLPAAWSTVDGMKTSRLNILKLARNKFSGPIPPGLAAAPTLTRLNLAANQFSGQLPTLENGAPFAAMLFFNISLNSIGGPLPNAYGKMRMFTQSGVGFVDGNNVMRPLTFVFDVSDNQLTGDIPPFLNKTSVEMAISKQWLKIDLSNNQFSNKCFSEVNYLGLCNEAPVDTNDGGLSGGAIFGIIVGVLAGVVLLALVVWVVVRKSRGGHLPMPSMPSLPSSKAAAFERFEDATPGPAMDGSGNTEGGPVPTSEGALVSEEPRQ